MKLTDVDIFPEDIETLNKRDPLRYCLTPEDAMLSHSVHGVIKYDYIDLGKTDYNFRQPFEQEEIQMYFERMNLLTTAPIDKLSERARELHLRRSDIKGNLRNAVGKIYPEMLKSNPIILHCITRIIMRQETGQRGPAVRGFISCLEQTDISMYCSLTPSMSLILFF